MSKTFLAVPITEKEEAKLAGARWDREAKAWYIGWNADKEKLKRWLPDKRNLTSSFSPHEEFTQALKSLGLIVSEDHPKMDGGKYRLSVEGDKKGEKSGFYIAFLNGHPAGYIKNHRTSQEVKWKSKNYINGMDKSVFQAKAVEYKQKHELDQMLDYQAASKRAAEMITHAVPVTFPTPYMRLKNIHTLPDMYTDEKNLMTYIPVRDETSHLWSIQCIDENGKKRFLKGGRKTGCFHAIGGMNYLKQAPVIMIAEGYATASTLFQIFKHSIVAAFDTGNLKHVASVLHKQFPYKPIVIAGDDDRHTEISQGINPGKTNALEAAALVKGQCIFPIFSDKEIAQAKYKKCFTDFNDLFNLSENLQAGIAEVRSTVKNILNQHSLSLKKIC